MKNCSGLVLMLLCCSLALSSFRPDVEIDNVVDALKAGNATALSRYFDSRVDVSLPDKSDNYSRIQAEMVLRDFFSNNVVTNFEIKHQGTSNASRYCIGTLLTHGGDYRTKVFLRQRENHLVLQEIEFSKN